MNILIAAHAFPPTHSSGAERRAQRMANWLAENGHKVTVFAVEELYEPGFRVEITHDPYPIHRLHYDARQGDYFKNLYDYPALGEAFRNILENNDFDLVHIVSGYLLGGQVIHSAHQYGLPVVITLTEYWFMCMRLNLMHADGSLCSGPESDAKCARCLLETYQRYRLPSQIAPGIMDVFWNTIGNATIARPMTEALRQRRQTLQAALDAVEMVVCPSNFLKDIFNAYGFDTSQYIQMRQGLQPPPSDVLRQPRSKPDDRLRLGYIGQIKYHKGVDLLIDAVIRLLDAGHKVSLDLWGSEAEEKQYVERLKARSEPYPTIRWKGRYTGSKVWDVLADMDMLVMPSRWYENSPNVILEAYEMGLPVIATRLGGMAELIEHERSGLLFTLNDADDLYNQIARVLHEPDLLPQLQSHIPEVKTIDQEMQELVGHYHTLLQS